MILAGYPRLFVRSRSIPYSPRFPHFVPCKMESKEKKINLFMVLLTPFALAAVIWAITGLSVQRIDGGVITLAFLTVFCSCYLRIQLPRVDIHLTISDGLIILSMLLYG